MLVILRVQNNYSIVYKYVFFSTQQKPYYVGNTSMITIRVCTIGIVMPIIL